MALSTDNTWKALTTQDLATLGTKAMVLKDAEQIYFGSLCSHDTDQGYVKAFDGTQTDRLVGWHWTDNKLGDTDLSPKPVATIKPGGFIVRDLPVTGVNNDQTDYGSEVYATDDGTYTTVDPGSGIVVGIIMADETARSTSKAHVFMRNVLELVS